MTEESQLRVDRLDQRLAETRQKNRAESGKAADLDAIATRHSTAPSEKPDRSSEHGMTAPPADDTRAETSSWEQRVHAARQRREQVLADRAAGVKETRPAVPAVLPDQPVSQDPARIEKAAVRETTAIAKKLRRLWRWGLALCLVGGAAAFVMISVDRAALPEPQAETATQVAPDPAPEPSVAARDSEPAATVAPSLPISTPSTVLPPANAPENLNGLDALSAPARAPDLDSFALPSGTGVERADLPDQPGAAAITSASLDLEGPPELSDTSVDWSDVQLRLYQTPAASADWISDLRAGLQSAGFAAPDPRAVQVGPNGSEVRFYHTEDAEAAAAIGAATGVRVRDFSTYRPSPATGTMEIWAGRTPN